MNEVERDRVMAQAFDAARILEVVERNQNRSAEAIRDALREAARRFGAVKQAQPLSRTAKPSRVTTAKRPRRFALDVRRQEV